MPASPSDARNKWRKRKRDPHVSRRQKQEEDEEDDDDVDDELDGEADDDNEQQTQQGPLSGAVPDHAPLMREVLSDGAVRISEFPSVVKHTVNRPHSSVLAIVAMERAIQFGDTGNQQSPLFLENISHGQLQALSAVPADSPSLATSDQERSDGGSYVVAPPQIMEGRGVIKRFWNGRVHAVPMHSDWFSPNTVHRLERQVVPHFFSGKSPEHTPELYMECRNFIVAKYMECPERRLLVSDCKGLVAGIPEEDLTRIVRFLDHWGIINYCAAAPPNCEPWSSTSYLREDSIGEVHVPSAALKSIDSLIKFDKPKCRLKAAELYSSLSCNSDEDSDLDCKIRERLSDNRCNYCSRPLPTVYYQSQKEVDVLLCTDCFYEGRFVIGHSSIDFMRVDSTKDYGDVDSESWSDQETLLLLEALESYNENWNDIAEHVGTKSKAQCILHFIRMPMEDGLLENIEVPSIPTLSNSLNKVDQERLHTNSNGNLTGSCLPDLDSDSRLPFANSGNPVMSMVAFLTTAVGPRVAAACAHASLIALSEDNALAAASGFIIPPEGSGHGNRMKEGGPPGDLTNSSQHKDGNIGKGSWGQNDAEVASLPVEKVRAAAKAGLAAAAMKAKLFADHEEREIQRLSANIINHQLKRLELKLKQFAEVETLLMKECEQVERARQRFVAERARIISSRFGPSGVTGVTSPVNLPGVAPALVNNNTGNNRQQIMSAPPSQPSISGYGSNNQQMHPHMSSSFMPRQPMFSFGPRLPLAAIQPSSSSPSPNAMFNNSGNSQPTLNHPMMRPVSGTSSGLG